MLNGKLSNMLHVWQVRHPGQSLPSFTEDFPYTLRPCFTEGNRVVSPCPYFGCLSAIEAEAPICQCNNLHTSVIIEGGLLHIICTSGCNNIAPPLLVICPSNKHVTKWMQLDPIEIL